MRKCKMCGAADQVEMGYCPICGRILAQLKEEDMEEREITQFLIDNEFDEEERRSIDPSSDHGDTEACPF